VLQEGALVAVIGAALAFAANALSPRGLLLTKNYFPGTTVALPAPVVAVTNATGVSAAKTNTPAALLSARFQAEGCNWPIATEWCSSFTIRAVSRRG